MQLHKLRKSHILSIALLILFIIGLEIFYITYEAHFSELGFPLDDPWIHMQFAKNLANGNGFSYNPKETVAGSTAPLWTLLLVPIHWLVQNITLRVLFVKILGISIFALCLLFAYLLSFRLTDNKYVSLIATLAVGTTSHLNWGTISGLEVPLYVLLTILIIYLVQVLKTSKNTNLKYYVPALIGLSVYSRPECALLFLFYILDNVSNFAKRQRLPFIFLSTLIFFVSLIPYFILNYSLSGSIFPNTFRAKAQQNSIFVALSTMNFQHLKWLFFKMAPAYFAQAIAHLFKANPLFVYGMFIGSLIIIYKKFKTRKVRPLSMMVIFVALFYAPLIGLLSPFISADFHNGRYIANQVACGSLLAVLGFYWLHQTIRNKLSKPLIRIVSVIIIAIAFYNTIFAQIFMIKYSASNVKSINEIQVKIGKWIKDNTPPEAIVAVNDIGAIAYFSERKIIDLCGLVNPEIIAYFKKYGDDKLGAYAYVLEKKPYYLAIFPRWFPRLIDTSHFEILYKIRYDKNSASEWVFIPEVQTFFGIFLKALTINYIPSEKWILKMKM